MTSATDRFKGALLAACLGDALGAPFEHGVRSPYTGFLGTQRVEHVGMYGNRRCFSHGQLTDDSEMIIVLLDHILKNGRRILRDDLILSYMAWASHKTSICLGRNTRQLLKGVTTIRGYAGRLAKSEGTSQGNGFLMRCMPLVLVDPAQWPIDCDITNPNDPSRQVQETYLLLLSVLVREGTIADPIVAAEMSGNPDVLDAVTRAMNGHSMNVADKSTKGWAIYGLYLAILSIHRFSTFAEMYAYVIGLGGDTDTNACIAGAMFGALHGYEKLREEQKDNLEILISCDTSDSTHPRPPRYRASWLMKLLDDMGEF